MDIAGYRVFKIPASTVVYAGVKLFQTFDYTLQDRHYFGTLDKALYYAFTHNLYSDGQKVIAAQFIQGACLKNTNN